MLLLLLLLKLLFLFLMLGIDLAFLTEEAAFCDHYYCNQLVKLTNSQITVKRKVVLFGNCIPLVCVSVYHF